MNMYNRKMSRRQPWHPCYRVRKDESGQHGGGQMGFTPPAPTPTPTQTQQPNNQGGNSGQSGGESQPQNNGGQGFDPSAFWGGSPGGSESPPSQEGSAGNTNQPGGQQQQQQLSPAQQLVQDIGGLSFGGGVMTDDAIKDLAEGKVESFHKNLDGFGRQITGQTIGLVARMMTTLKQQMEADFQSKLNGTFQQRDNDSDLIQAIPSAADPAVKKTIQPIFDRAMQIAKGDRKAALGITKDMLKFVATQTGDDIGLPPRSAGDSDALQSSNVNWLEELAGR